MTETWLSVKAEPLSAWAGLWRTSDEWGNCYTGVMTECALELAQIHHRAPVIMEKDQWRIWLTAPLHELYQFSQPLAAERIEVEVTDRPSDRRKTLNGSLSPDLFI